MLIQLIECEVEIERRPLTAGENSWSPEATTVTTVHRARVSSIPLQKIAALPRTELSRPDSSIVFHNAFVARKWRGDAYTKG